MSYCRWSSDDFKCDLYIYECVDETWTIHIASNRMLGDLPPERRPKDATDKAQMADWVESRRERSAFLDVAEHVDIGLRHDGETFKLSSPGECADKCAELAALGYNFPAHVIPNLREEQSDLDDAEQREVTATEGEVKS